MSWTFDADSQSLYIRLTDHQIAEQDEMPDGTVVDLDAEGEAVGIEVLRTWAPWDLAAVAERLRLSDETVQYLQSVSDVVSRMSVRTTSGRGVVQEESTSAANALGQLVDA
jgi:uncharacterized protein YuzE